VTASFLPAAPARPPRFSARRPIGLATEQSHEGIFPPPSPLPVAASLHRLVLSNCRYLENLEAQLAEQSRLQARVKELEIRLLELEPGTQPSRSGSTQQFLTPPEVSSTTNRYLSPGLEASHNQSVSPRIPGYPDADIYNGSRLQNNEDDTDPGVFEAGEAGKGWYLGSASGSTSSG
jgi:hypothetical protein